MTIIEIDRILAAVERARQRGTIPRHRLVATVAQALGISQAQVRAVMAQEGVAV